MPLYEWECEKCGHREQSWATIADRDISAPRHKHTMKRLPGGTGMLWAEEGRPRYIQALGDKPITSEAQRKRLARINGVVECGNEPPASVKRNPKSEGMKRFLSGDKGGRWI